MKAWLLTIIGVVLAIWRFFVPTGKYQAKREKCWIRLQEIQSELDEVTLKGAEAKANREDVIALGLDLRRERLLKQRRECQRQYDHYERLCSEKG